MGSFTWNPKRTDSKHRGFLSSFPTKPIHWWISIFARGSESCQDWLPRLPLQKSSRYTEDFTFFFGGWNSPNKKGRFLVCPNSWLVYEGKSENKIWMIQLKIWDLNIDTTVWIAGTTILGLDRSKRLRQFVQTFLWLSFGVLHLYRHTYCSHCALWFSSRGNGRIGREGKWRGFARWWVVGRPMQCGCNALGSSVMRSERSEVEAVQCLEYWSHTLRCGGCSRLLIRPRPRRVESPIQQIQQLSEVPGGFLAEWIVFLGVINQRPRAARVSLEFSGLFFEAEHTQVLCH